MTVKQNRGMLRIFKLLDFSSTSRPTQGVLFHARNVGGGSTVIKKPPHLKREGNEGFPILQD